MMCPTQANPTRVHDDTAHVLKGVTKCTIVGKALASQIPEARISHVLGRSASTI